MHNKIRPIIASFFITIFVLCNTPVSFLHALFANHEDTHTTYSFQDNPQITIAGIDCHTFGNVTTAPFISDWFSAKLYNPISFKPFACSLNKSVFSVKILSEALRAPPFGNDISAV